MKKNKGLQNAKHFAAPCFSVSLLASNRRRALPLLSKGSALFFHASSGGSGAAYCSGLLFSCSFTKLLICSNA